jgi:hypothetical protein
VQGLPGCGRGRPVASCCVGGMGAVGCRSRFGRGGLARGENVPGAMRMARNPLRLDGPPP